MTSTYLATYDYELEVLIAGVDNDGAHIYAVYNPGTSECFDSIGHHAIGSGEPHATFSLVEGSHCHGATLQEAMWSVFEAKRRAEKAPGVGESHDFSIVEMGSIIPFGMNLLDKLGELYKESLSKRKQSLSELKAKFCEIPVPNKNDKK